MINENDPVLIAQQWKELGREVAIATVIKTWGSAPCQIGSHLIINEQGDFMGSVSGGCVEAEVIAQSKDVIETRRSKILEFDVADETAWRVGLSCGGRIKILVECLS